MRNSTIFIKYIVLHKKANYVKRHIQKQLTLKQKKQQINDYQLNTIEIKHCYIE